MVYRFEFANGSGGRWQARLHHVLYRFVDQCEKRIGHLRMPVIKQQRGANGFA